MLTLKDIHGISAALGDTPLSQSPIWNAPVDKIVPAQLTAFRARMALKGEGEAADAAIRFLLMQVNEAVKRGEIPPVELLDYYEPTKKVLMSGVLVEGFAKMKRPMPAAILFGLEMALPADKVVTLTWKNVSRLKMTPFAWRIIKSQPIHLFSPYVFWQQSGKSVMPIFGLEQEVFDAYGMVWGELMNAYECLSLA